MAQRQIKRDINQFPVFKRREEWPQFQLDFEATAVAQGMEDIIDLDWDPTVKTQDQLDAFKEKSKFMFSVMTRTFKTDEGEALIREHIKTKDAHQVYLLMVEFMTESKWGDITATKILNFLTTFRFGLNSWKGGAVSFIIYFKEQARLYYQLCCTTKRSTLTEDMKLKFLDQAVVAIPDLRNTRTTYETARVMAAKSLNFNDYFDLLHRAAITYDQMQRSQIRSNVGESRQAYQALVNEDHTMWDSQPYHVWEAHAHERGDTYDDGMYVSDDDDGYGVNTPPGYCQRIRGTAIASHWTTR